MTVSIHLPSSDLDPGLHEIHSPELVEQILKANLLNHSLASPAPPTHLVTPNPGFVVKTRIEARKKDRPGIQTGDKIFLNIGSEAGVPGAPDISEVSILVHHGQKKSLPEEREHNTMRENG